MKRITLLICNISALGKNSLEVSYLNEEKNVKVQEVNVSQ